MALLERGDQLPDLFLADSSGTAVSLGMLAGEPLRCVGVSRPSRLPRR